MRNTSKSICLAIVATLLQACGGGGGNGSTPSASPSSTPLASVPAPPGGSVPAPSGNTTVDTPATGNPTTGALPPSGNVTTSPTTQGRGLPSDFDARALFKINGVLTTVSQKGLKATSTDGENWIINTTQTGLPDNSASSVQYLNGKFYATTQPNGLYSSLDAVTWTKVVGASESPSEVANNGSTILVMVGKPNAAGGASISRSADNGATWTPISGVIANETWTAVSYSSVSNSFVIVGANGKSASSSDLGLTWQISTDASSPYFQAVTYSTALAKFVAGGNQTRMFQRDAGGSFTEFSPQTGPTGANILRIKCFDSPKVTCIATSAANGSGGQYHIGNFTPSTTPLVNNWAWYRFGNSAAKQQNLWGIEQIGNRWIAVGQSGSNLVSDDASGWSEIPSR